MGREDKQPETERGGRGRRQEGDRERGRERQRDGERACEI